MRLCVLLTASAVAVSLTCCAEPHPERTVASEEVPLLEPNPIGGPACVELQLQDGTQLLFAIDTACPSTCVNKTAEPMLGKQISNAEVDSAFYGSLPARTHQTPAIYLGKTLLIMPRNLYVMDALPNFTKYPQIVGVLGTDCLSNYCVQVDFPAKKLRLLQREEMQKADLGGVFPMQAQGPGWMISMPSPIWGRAAFIVDTGLCGDCDGLLTAKLFRRTIAGLKLHVLSQYTNTTGQTITNFGTSLKIGSSVRSNILRMATFPIDFGSTKGTGTLVQFLTAQVGEEAYAEMVFGEEPSRIRRRANLLGFRFLSRHVATFDFPDRCLYLKHVERERRQ